MQRTQHSTLLVDANGTGKDGFTNGDPGVTAATVVDADVMNSLQEEVAGTIEGLGLTLALSNQGQLLQALRIADVIKGLQAFRTSDSDLSSNINALAFNALGGTNRTGFAVGASGAISAKNSDHQWSAATAGSAYAGTFNAVVAPWGSADTTWGAVAVGSGEEIQTSQGGWTERHTGAENLLGIARTDDGSTHVACGANAKILQSTAPATWTSRTSALSGTLYGIAYGAGLFVIAGANGIQTSPDGITWTSRAGTGGSGNYTLGVQYFNGVFLASAGGSVAVTSTDGITWTAPAGLVSGGSASSMLCLGSCTVLRAEPFAVWGPTFAEVFDGGPNSTTGGLTDTITAMGYDSDNRLLWMAGDAGLLRVAALPFGV